jgi:hypothetical protein
MISFLVVKHVVEKCIINYIHGNARALPYCIIIFLHVCFLFTNHMYYMSGDAWKEGSIDATGMVY